MSGERIKSRRRIDQVSSVIPAALDAVRALLAAEIIEEEAADAAVQVLIPAEMIEEAAADEAVSAVLATEEDE
jgi:hypothetical protein